VASESSTTDDALPQSNTNVSHPLEKQNPAGNKPSLDHTLLRIDQNMRSMTQLLTSLCATPPPPADTENEGKLLTAKDTSQKRAQSPSASDEDDKLSVHAASSDNEVDLIMGETMNLATREADTSTPKNSVTGNVRRSLNFKKNERLPFRMTRNGAQK